MIYLFACLGLIVGFGIMCYFIFNGTLPEMEEKESKQNKHFVGSGDI